MGYISGIRALTGTYKISLGEPVRDRGARPETRRVLGREPPPGAKGREGARTFFLSRCNTRVF
jgi:hypothetical protein